jgi:hypothetical protein
MSIHTHHAHTHTHAAILLLAQLSSLSTPFSSLTWVLGNGVPHALATTLVALID